MLNHLRPRLSTRQVMMTGVTTFIAFGFAGLMTPAQAQQESASTPIVQVANLTAEQESILKTEAVAPFTHSVQATAPDLKAHSASPSDADKIAAKPLTLVAPSLGKPNEKCGQLPPVGMISPFPISLRLGAMVSPNTKFAGGIDVTIPGVHLLPHLSTRIDADAIVSANLGGISTLIPITVDQVFSQGLIVGSKVYIGGGIGPYIGDTTRFGGKAFIGAGISSRLSAELDVHFPGFGDPLITVQARIGL